MSPTCLKMHENKKSFANITKDNYYVANDGTFEGDQTIA